MRPAKYVTAAAQAPIANCRTPENTASRLLPNAALVLVRMIAA
jgi:hypothetical protein